jgi:hypothetical protein
MSCAPSYINVGSCAVGARAHRASARACQFVSGGVHGSFRELERVSACAVRVPLDAFPDAVRPRPRRRGQRPEEADSRLQTLASPVPHLQPRRMVRSNGQSIRVLRKVRIGGVAVKGKTHQRNRHRGDRDPRGSRGYRSPSCIRGRTARGRVGSHSAFLTWQRTLGPQRAGFRPRLRGCMYPVMPNSIPSMATGVVMIDPSFGGSAIRKGSSMFSKFERKKVGRNGRLIRAIPQYI